MSDAVADFLARQGWDGAEITPIAGDLSARRYLRVTRAGRRAVLMDARALPASIAPFLAMTRWLRDRGFSAPDILSDTPSEGLILLEDLGASTVNAALSKVEIRNTAIDLLLALRAEAPPALSRPSARQLCDWTRLADDFYPGADGARLEAFRAALETVLTPLCAEPATLSLRDFHAENLIWLPERTGTNRLGLLDYQDAFLCHPVYDLVSICTDARTEFHSDTVQSMVSRYLEFSGDDPAGLSRAFAAFSLQRNLRILGIFHRAARVDGKAHHLPKIPRVYRHVTEALAHPVFAELRGELSRALPPPGGCP